jgi:UDP-N-acetylmuramate--alanine ligase
MSPLAHILMKLGHRVSGSDLHVNTVISHLIQEGATVHVGHHQDHVGQPDVVVFSSAIKPDNVEYQRALELGVALIPRSQLLADLMIRYHGIVVAGSHGKTSTTALIYWALNQLQQNPSTIFGGRFNHEPISARFGEGPYMVVESDESDGSFLRLHPTVAVLTNIDREHTEHYGSFESLVAAFHAFLTKLPFYGFSVISSDCPHSVQAAAGILGRILRFGFTQPADFWVERQDLPWHNGAYRSVSELKVHETSRTPMVLQVHVCADHQVRNVLAAYAVLRGLGFEPDQLRSCFQTFPGVQRRLQNLTPHSEWVVVSDYAHHPTELAATLQGCQNLYPGPLTLVFQPHRYSRFTEHAATFALVLKTHVHRLIILPVYAASEKPNEWFFDCWEKWIASLKQANFEFFHVCSTGSSPSLVDLLRTSAKPREPLLFCGAGDIHATALEVAKGLISFPHEVQDPTFRV